MRESISLPENFIDRNWVLKRKRKRASSGLALSKSKDKERISLGSDSPSSKSLVKKKPRGVEISQFGQRIKGHDGYYFECEVCDLGGNLLCCDSCPRTYHLECLNPPLKRAPPGKWQCPSCCEQKNDVKTVNNVETSTRRIRTKSNVDKFSGHDKPLLSERIPTAQKNKSSNKDKRMLPFRALSIEKKSGYSQIDISLSPKPSPSSDDEYRAEIIAADGSSAKKNQVASSFSKASCDKEVHSPVDTLNMEKTSKEEGSLNKRERKQKKHILSLVWSTEISKKDRHKVGKKKRSQSHKGKHSAAVSNQTSKGTSLLPETNESLRTKALSNQQNYASITKKGSRVLKLSIRKKPEISTQEASPSSHLIDELGEKADKTTKYHENPLEGVQQVDRILGRRVQASTGMSSCDAQAIKSLLSAELTKSASDSEKLASLSPSCPFTDPENGYKLLEETNDSDKIQDKTDAIALHDEDMNANNGLAEGKTDEAKESNNKDDFMMETESLKDQHITQGSSEFHEESAVCAHVMADATVTADSEENRDVGAANVGNNGNHPDSSPKKSNSTKAAQDTGSKNGNPVSYEFLVKWVGQSNIHNSWISESQLKILAKRKLENYKAKYGIALINICEEQWCEPQRVIALRVSNDGMKEVLTKWNGLSYDECTWERLDEPVIEKSAHLVAEYEQWESQTFEKDARHAIPRAKVDFQEVVPLMEQPKELQGGSLFPHQLEALNWLRKCWHKSKNVVLADEMGLGKTVSACAFISSLYIEFKANLPCLVLVPLSTMPNWLAEFSLWAPHLNVVEYHGPAKARSIIRQYEWHASEAEGSRRVTSSYKFNVLLTTYEMILADSSHLRGVTWEVLVVDEGHRLKNSESKLFSLLNTFSFKHRVLLTGTPLQNNIGEMYNLLNFLQPASFPSLSAFEEKFNDLTTAEKVEELKKLVAPHMLRRLKKDAMQNIPPKTERMVPVELTSIQAEYYRAMLTKNYQILRNAGKGCQQQSMLNIVMQLRKVCNHPYLIPGTEPEAGSVEFLQEMRIKASAKLTLLHSMLKVLHKEGHRVLIFSQMTKLLDILEDYLVIEFGPRTFERVDGSVSVADRQTAIARFNQDKSRFVFLLSTRSCGLGINLASADTVIIYDSDFNPHADIQAMNRAHRIGQSKRLLVYRLVVRASVEERILQLAKKKLMLDQLFVNKSESQKEVEDIIRWGTEELFNDCDGVNGQDSKEPSSSQVETATDGEHKHRRRSGGLGDVYQDRITDSCTKVVWDDTAILKLLDRTNLQSSVPESADGDVENDMLGSVKSLDWNDELNDDPEGTELLPSIIGDACEQLSEAKDDSTINVIEENEWDKLLRLRWEQYQTEEEAALGRGKRQRKAISYKETFAQLPSEVLSEQSGQEDEEPEPVYTPAGRALKEKYAKLRARQKERISCRNNTEVMGSSDKTELRESQVLFVKETRSPDAGKCLDDAREVASPMNLEETNASQPSESKRNNSTAKLGKVAKHGHKRYHSTRLDLCGNVSPDIFLPSHQIKSEVSANPVPMHLLPVLGLCAPNASQMNSASRKSHSTPHRRSSDPDKKKTSTAMPETPFPLPVSAGPSHNLNIGVQEPTTDPPPFPDISMESMRHRMKNIIPDNFFPFAPPPPKMSGRVPRELLESSSGSFSSFQERLGLPSLLPDDNPYLAFALQSTNSMKLQPDLLPSLSLGTNMDDLSQDFPNIPLVSKFSQMTDSLKQKHKMEELPPMLGLGQLHASHSSLPENHKKVLDNIIMRTQSVASKVWKKISKLDTWSEDELDALWIGVRRHGRGNWDAMLRDPKLKFSRNKSADVLATRWIEEQHKIMDEQTFAVPKSSKPDFLGISDGMMNRALFGSKMSNLGSEPPKFRSHLTDIKLACGDRSSGFPFIDPATHLGVVNEKFPSLPSWLPNKPGSSYSRDFHVPHFNNLEKMNLAPDNPFQKNSIPVSTFESLSTNLPSGQSLQMNDHELNVSKKTKLPSYLDKSLNLLRDTHNSLQSIQPNIGMPPNFKKKQIPIKSPSDDENAASSSKANKLPHWLREAVSVPPTRPPEPHLPPTVSAIAQSVRVLYGEDKPTIPPFSIPGPPPFQPKDPRKSLKMKRKLHRLLQEAPEVTNGLPNFDHASIPPAPSILRSAPYLPRTDLSSSRPSLNLNLDSTTSSSFATHMKNSSPALTSCVPSEPFAPEVPQMSSVACLKSELPVPEDLEISQQADREEIGDTEGSQEKLKESTSSLSDSGEKLKDKEADRMGSGDSVKTQSEKCGADQIEVEEISSEKTVSDEHKSEHEP